MTDEEMGSTHEQIVSLMTVLTGRLPDDMLGSYRRMVNDMRPEMEDDNIMSLAVGAEALILTFRKAIRPMGGIEAGLIFTMVTALVLVRNAHRIEGERDAGGHGTEANVDE